MDDRGIALLTVAYHSHEALDSLARDLLRQTRQPCQWLLVNNSPESSGELRIRTRCPLSILQGREGDGFGEGCNRGLEKLEEW